MPFTPASGNGVYALALAAMGLHLVYGLLTRSLGNRLIPSIPHGFSIFPAPRFHPCACRLYVVPPGRDSLPTFFVASDFGCFRMRLGIVLLVLLSGCGKDRVVEIVPDTYEFMPLDGTRSWSYAKCWPDADSCAEDEARLSVSMADTDGRGRATLLYENSDGASSFQVSWVSDQSSGVSIEGWSADGGSQVELATPCVILSEPAEIGKTVVSMTTEGRCRSTVVGFVERENRWSNSPWEMVHVILEGPDSLPLDGELFLASSYGMAGFQPSDEPSPWVLDGAAYQAGP